jgi:hypothetical protein
MYYKESTQLIEKNPFDKGVLTVLDRELAHAYAPTGGLTELPLLVYATGAQPANVQKLLTEYEGLGVVESYEQVECPCGEGYDGRKAGCPECGVERARARPTDVTVYVVKKQPTAPAFDPALMPKTPDVFVSYRHADAATLAADIYYSLLLEGKKIFLDRSDIAVGADPSQVYLRAASNAKYFIALVSETYFDSPYCRKEIAHSLRMRRRLIRVNLSDDAPSAPPEMPWLGKPNWLSHDGDGEVLSVDLEAALRNAVQTPASADVADLRRQACRYLLEKLSKSEFDAVWGRLSWMDEYDKALTKQEKIDQIMKELTEERVEELCNALAP